jgi:hypothetical protein
MRFSRCTALGATLALLGAPAAHGLDFSHVTCGAFLASGERNMAALIMFMRGYHAGRTGTIPYNSADRYGAKLGSYCRQHPDANLIQSSEKVLIDLDRGL